MDYLFNIVVFIVVLGELVFFHEMGHFLAAKACGIYCERFSLGMPPRLFGFRFGETDYCVGLLPIGGYVKMAGQEDVPMTDEERKEQYGNIPPDRWFSKKPVWQRVIVIAAGPFMNVVLAVLLYGIVAAVGAHVPESEINSRIGLVRSDSPAANALLFEISNPGERPDMTEEPDAYGWQTGDRILTISGNPVSNIRDVAMDAILSAGEPLLVELERMDESGTITRYFSKVQPVPAEGDDYPQFGVAAFHTALVGRVTRGSPADKAGIQTGDVITEVNEDTIDALTFSKLVSDITTDEPIHIQVVRNSGAFECTITPTVVGQLEGVFFENPYSHLVIPEPDKLEVTFSSPEFHESTGLRRGDVIKSIDGETANAYLLQRLEETSANGSLPVTIVRKTGLFSGSTKEIEKELSLSHIRQAVTKYDLQAKPVIENVTNDVQEETGLVPADVVEAIDGEPATLEKLGSIESRPGETITLTVRTPPILFGLLRKSTTRDVELPIVSNGQVGVIWDTKMVFHRVAPSEVVPTAFRESWLALTRTVRTLQLLLTGGLQADDIGGPVMIFQITTQAAREGYSWLLKITAFISVNLAVFNLLPLPVLDGGHLVFLTIEGVRRKPVHPKVTEWVQQAGLVLIIALMLFVTFNDIKRWLFGTFMP